MDGRGGGPGGLHKPEDAGGCVCGSVTALAEEVMEGMVVFAELLPAGLVMEQVFEFAVEVVGG